MEQPTSSGADDTAWQGRRLSHSDFEQKLARRRAETGITTITRNSGKRRTASKRALLKAIEEAGGRW